MEEVPAEEQAKTAVWEWDERMSMEKYLDYEAECPVCGHLYKGKRLSGFYVNHPADLDTNPHLPAVFDRVMLCPVCGYAAEDLRKPVTGAVKPVVTSEAYQRILHDRGLSENTRKMLLHSVLSEKAGNIGKERAKEMQIWTKEEYQKFSLAIMDKPMSFYAFEMLYWCGIREGELLALTPSDFHFDTNIVSITKSYQRLKGQDVITPPKTEKSNRVIAMPSFLKDEMQDYLRMLYDVGDHDRIFQITKSYLHREMDRGAKESGVKRIRIHDLRHSHISLLIDMGFSATAIADRVGHESIDITYHYAHLFPSKQTEMADKLNMERSA